MQPSVGTTKMSTRGQVIIPKETREFTGSCPETIFTVFPLSREIIVLKKLDKKKAVEEFKALRAKVSGKIPEAKVNEIAHRER
ncbi:MAG: AbrB/MazE/SpoVT family DNA-binding domain-containing protein [Candidatus Diapherotrites archaeon]|uniref:AbrB/MazE/SpoVT family DNA-binding domain-containing protein n=1 Tax=Candidatus Iainarchaeum sp. TaxID=3101447 RepID=A0A938YXA5_9ARCH|nr:AbrB/MazE/SpoVT family DNA-binding domain-containing protein [Candidatus Diapherotrites archaeon]